MKILVLTAALLLSGCAGRQQSVLDSAGVQASKIENLWWFFLWLLGAIFVAVMAVLLLALRRNGRGPTTPESKLNRVVTGATVVTILILLGLIVVSVATGKSISHLGDTKNGMVVELTGNQWWWYVRYLDDQAGRSVVTANEIHIPVGRPVMIRGSSNDVIHSFWVPNLHGKRDLIPSRMNTEWIQADKPGRYRGQCAEFCGAQHAHMAMWVVAETPSEFAKWMEHQREPGIAPATAARQRGQEIFLNKACVFCHAIAGTRAMGQTGPDLTHFGSRLTIAAGTLPNTKGYLGGWIADPQNSKPGNHMATVPLNGEEVEPLLDYLESLK